MREILFRGKRKDNGKWVEGWYVPPVDYRGSHWDASISYKVKEGHLEDVEVIPESISEFTGLTDKNGKKIFEGDIVAGALYWQELPKNGVVAFRDGSFGLVWYRGDIEHFNPFTSMCNITYEVIGNIHDNPELLKGGGEG